MTHLRSTAALVALLGSVLIPLTASAERVRMGRVRVTSTPSRAQVFLDGATEPAGQTPVRLRMPRGEHEIRVVLEGHAPATRTFELSRASARVAVELIPLVTLEIGGADESATGAEVLVDGEVVGSVPCSHGLAPGRHQLAVRREGYEPYERWVELAAGRDQSIEVALQASTPATGSVLVAGNVPGAAVIVDGEPAGTSPVVVDLAPGRHIIEIRPEGRPNHSEVVVVEEGRRLTVNPTLQPPPPETGTLAVVTSPAGARIWLDGREQGIAPLTLEEVAPGAHIVEARAEGRQDAVGRVSVEAGRQESLHLELEAAVVTGSVRVASSVAGAEVLIDGAAVGTAPLVHEGLSPGEHQVVVRAPGHEEWSQAILLTGSEQIAVQATPGARGRLSVETTAAGAVVLVDGDEIGPAPVTDHELDAGDHVVEIRAEGFVPFTRRVNVVAGSVAHITAELPAAEPADDEASGEETEEEPVDEEPEEPRVWQREGSLFANSAIPMRPYRFTMSGSWGWPFLLGTYRLGVGVYDNMDVSIEVRSSYYFTEIDAHLRYGFRFARIVGIGGEVSVGGGFGQDGRDTALLGITLWEGLELGPVAIALRQRLQVFWDEYDTTEDRHVSARVFVGASVEWRILGPLYTFLIVDYAPYPPAQADRRALCGGSWDDDDGCSHWMKDINLDARLGVGVTFF